MSSRNYEKLETDSVDTEEAESFLSHRPGQRQPAWMGKHIMGFPYHFATVILLIVSILGNAVLVGIVTSLRTQREGRVLHPKTDYLDLRLDVPREIGEDEATLYDPFWNSPIIDDNLGVVALGPEFVKEKNLPETQMFPWDETKGIYILSFHHSLHCLRWMRQSVLESHTDRPQSGSLGHLTHCINVLREDIYCHADDTLRYTGRMHNQTDKTEPKSGVGQYRQCVDFNKFYDWAIENSACYGLPDDPDAPMEDYYKNCPDGRVLWDK